jgi:hypothetical protein
MVHPREAEVGVGQPAQTADDLVRANDAGLQFLEKAVQGGFVHRCPCCHALGRSLQVR